MVATGRLELPIPRIPSRTSLFSLFAKNLVAGPGASRGNPPLGPPHGSRSEIIVNQFIIKGLARLISWDVTRAE